MIFQKEYKEISLTQGKVAFVDAEDYAYLNQFKWCAVYNGYNWYAVRNIPKNGKQTLVLMHREIMKPPKGMDTDHINGNGLDNRRCNLRVCNKSQNMMNRGKTKENTSGYKGVAWDKRAKKWKAHIRINSKLIYLGLFITKEEAALVYNKASKEYFGEYAKLNEVNILHGRV